jgi:hypothetical protein
MIIPKFDTIKKMLVFIFGLKIRNTGMAIGQSVDILKIMDIELYFNINKSMEAERKEAQAISCTQDLEICLAVISPMSNLNKTNVIGAEGTSIYSMVSEVYHKRPMQVSVSNVNDLIMGLFLGCEFNE